MEIFWAIKRSNPLSDCWQKNAVRLKYYINIKYSGDTETVKRIPGEGEKLSRKLSFFAPHDIFIYAFVLLAIAALFLAFSVFNGDEKAVGFSVSVNGEDIFSLDYDDAEHYFYDDKFGGIIEVSVEEGKIIVYLSPDKKDLTFPLVEGIQ